VLGGDECSAFEGDECSVFALCTNNNYREVCSVFEGERRVLGHTNV
jgi:hypothetical protein